MEENEIGSAVVDCAVALHRDLGPGLLETVYEVTLARALERRGLRVERQVAVSIEYEGETFAEGFRADLIVEGKVLLELKSVERVTPAHKKQLLTYLRLTGLKLGYLLNFGEALMRDGITRTINGSLDLTPLSLRASVREKGLEEGFSQRHGVSKGLTL
jgi:GxxExxY protein